MSSTKRLSPTSELAHNQVAEILADQYISNLSRVALGSPEALAFGTLFDLAKTFWLELAQEVRRRASIAGGHRVIPRVGLVVERARVIIARCLRGESTPMRSGHRELGEKLLAIREAQDVASLPRPRPPASA